MQHMKLLDLVGLRPERAPVEAPPVTNLQVNQSGQNEEHRHSGHDALFIHEGEKLRAATLATRSGNGTPKVNECARRVKLVAMSGATRWAARRLSPEFGEW